MLLYGVKQIDKYQKGELHYHAMPTLLQEPHYPFYLLCNQWRRCENFSKALLGKGCCPLTCSGASDLL